MESVISLKPPNRDWQALERKIGQGVPLKRASEECGIPWGEIVEYARSRMDDFEAQGWHFSIVGQAALKTGLSTLEKIASEGPRFGDKLTTVHSTDLDAAIALTKLGIEAAKLSSRFGVSKAKAGAARAQEDLFDRIETNPWLLRDPGEV